ncbi:MAG: GNAT family N-acetyltransferase [Epsilonproteobacteria bacterium]|nr:GNAT family N-acetyltransferase [Campylobacterota bacterium]
MTEHIEIKQATERDAAILSTMTGELLHEIMDKIDSKVFHFDQKESTQKATELFSKNLYFVFIATDLETKKPIGFISMYESYALYAEGAYGTIPELYIRPTYRSKQIGELLLSEAKAFAKQKKWKRLEVTTPPLPEFDRSLRFYEGNGFEITGGRKLKSDIV